MASAASRPADGPVLILAPAGRDAAVIEGILAGAGLSCITCKSADNLVGLLDDAAAAIMVEEAVEGDYGLALAGWVDRQPSWSDFPFVLLTQRSEAGTVSTGARSSLELLGNVALLERPCYALTLLSAVRAAVRARKRQLELASELDERRRVQDVLHETEQRFRHELEELVRERADALAQETAERKQAQTALLQAQKMEAIGQLTAGIAARLQQLAHDYPIERRSAA